MGKLTPEMIIAIQTEYAKCHSYSETAKKLGKDERTVRKHAHGLNGNSSTTNRGGVGKTTSSSGADHTEMNKTIYKELRRGKKHDEIVEKHGFPSGYVQAEFELFNRNRDTDMIEFQKRYINDIETLVKSYLPDLLEYIGTFRERGYLTNDELLILIEKVSEGS